MAEPLSVAGLAISVVDIACKLHNYISSARNAKDDIRRLSVELLALKGALDLFGSLKASAPASGEMLALTHQTLRSIDKRVQPPSSAVGRAVRSLTWPFKSPEVANLVAALERSKTFFIMVIMQDAGDSTTAVLAEMKTLTAAVHEGIVEHKADRMAAEMKDLLRWLAPYNSLEEHRKASRARAPGTGKWFMDEAFDAWSDASSDAKPLLWITSKSGSGKTVLASSLVDELETRCSLAAGPALCAFHYCSLDRSSSQSASNVFGSVLAQMANAVPEIIEAVRPFRRQGEASLALTDAFSLLSSTAAHFRPLYLVVDALNETPDQEDVISMLLGLCRSCRNLRVLVTCTLDPKQDDHLIQRTKMNLDAVDRDIELYVGHRLVTEQRFNVLSRELQDRIFSLVAHDADGTFRWAQLCMDRLSALPTGRHMRAALEDMPSTLNETYADILAKVPDSNKDIVREALMWLCFSRQPLTPSQLAEAVVLEESDRSLDDDCRLKPADSILDICRTWIQVDDDLVTLAHDSIRSFLTTSWIRTSPVAEYALDPRACHKAMMRKCLAYISFDEFAAGYVDRWARLEKRFDDWPLLDYASVFWPHHAQRCELAASDEKLMLDMFATKAHKRGGVFESWVQCLIQSTDAASIRRTEPLYYAASYNMVAVIKILLRPGSGTRVDQRGGRFACTPLSIACFRRNTEAAKLLLEAGADPDAYDAVLTTPRNLAARRKMDDVLELMGKRMGRLSVSKDEPAQQGVGEATAPEGPGDADALNKENQSSRGT